MFVKIELRKIRDFSAKINVTFEFLRQNFKILAKGMIYLAGPFIVLQGIFMGFYQQSIFSLNPNQSESALGTWATQLFFSVGLGALFQALSYAMILVVINVYFSLYEQSEDPSTIEMPQVWDGVKSAFFKTFGAFFVGLFCVSIASLFLFIPGIYLFVCFSLMGPLLIIERQGIGEAFSRCFKLITEKWWSTFGLIIVTGLIAGTMGFAFQIPQYVFLFATALHKASNAMAEPPAWQQVGAMLSSILAVLGADLLYSIVFVSLSFQFYNLVERREVQGLMTKMDSFGKSDAQVHRTDETY